MNLRGERLDERTYLTIDVVALRRNISLVKAKTGNSKIMCMVKADAYGCGAARVAKYCEDLVDYFGVASVDEGVELRKSGIVLPILVVGNAAPSRYADAVDFDIRLTVSSLEAAQSLNDFCLERGKRAKVHLAIDSGMGRIGFLPNELNQAVRACRLDRVFVEGIFTHFAKADESDKAYTLLQKRVFDDFVCGMWNNGVSVGLRHVANSAAILDMPGCNYDMVRMGLITYGLYPSVFTDRNIDLTPVMSWYARIVHIKTLPKGSMVSYGGDYVTKGDTQIATLAVGYGDGYPRALSDRGRVIVAGRRVPIVGRVCMDQTMVDVTGIDDVKAGDIATLVGSQGEIAVTLDELAKLCNTINYEVACGISHRVARKYVE